MPAGFMMQIKGQIAEVEAAMEAIHREAAQRTISFAQTPIAQGGNMPVKTGFLRSTGQAALGAAPAGAIDNPNPHGSFNWDAGQVLAVIGSATVRDTINFSWTAKYAGAANYGANGRPGHHFLDLAVQQYPQIVDEVAKEAEARLKG